VVFVEGEELWEKVGSYEWEVRDADTASPLKSESTAAGVFEFKPDKIGSLVVTVSILNEDGNQVLRVLKIQQKVQAPNVALEVMLTDPMDRAALGGHPDTTRELVNDLKPYVDAAFKSSAYPDKVPRRLLAAVAYLQVFETPKFWRSRHRGLELAAEELNGVFLSSFTTQIDNALGVCQIRPQTLAMILRDPNSEDGVWDSDMSLDPQDQISEAYPNWRELSYDKEQRGIERKAILKAYNGLALETKIDLYNLLRFPKANIRLCFELLTHLKEREHRYPAETTAEFLENTHGIQIIGTEFKIGGVESPLPENAPQGEEGIRANSYGKKVLKTVYSPYMALDLGGTLMISGRVTDASTGNPIVGARVDLYETKLRVVEDTLGCFGHYDEILQTTEEYVELKQGDELAVLEVLREPPEHPNADIVKVNKFPGELISNEGWVVARSGDNYHAHLLSNLEEDVERTDSNGEFALAVSEFQPYKIRTVRAPVGEDGYFDGETETWILPPRQGLNISMEPAKNLIIESEIVKWLNEFKGFDYRPSGTTAKYPASLRIHDFGLNLPKAPPKKNDCCSFVEGLLISAWKDKYEDEFDFSLSQHKEMMIIGVDADKYGPVTTAIELGMAEGPGIAGDDVKTLPRPWMIVQGWEYANYTGGHTFIVLDTHQETGKVLTLESSNATSDKLNGPGFRWMGSIDDFIEDDDIAPNREKCWPQNHEIKAWEEWLGKRFNYKFVKMARLKVYDLRWARRPIL
jgi:hypothetical protein